MILSDQTQWSLLERVRDGEIRNDPLKDMRDDCLVNRVFLDGGEFGCGETLILKMWSRPGISGLLRRITRTAPFMNEALALRVLREQGVRVPQLLGHKHLGSLLPPYTDALFVEDLGSCEFSGEHIKGLLALGRAEEARTIVSDVLDMTERMVDARIIEQLKPAKSNR